ncbi:spectrin beta chain, non-erythrocytic 1 [Nephila pilipes]|uniref:Spectrin beta chain, non-erythrocytic 1 n=1 Tax=Nephila pilipes TaxID=299642 RepID=A0A8X6P294_NEPPI|nr:spectrin beta chain, non-erythrocytic 1 [Nephila pilipes]
MQKVFVKIIRPTKLFQEDKQYPRSSYAYELHCSIYCKRKRLSDGEFVKQCMLQVRNVLCPDKKNNFETVNLSRKTVTPRIEAIDQNLTSQLESKIGQFKFCSIGCIAMDESFDTGDTAQLVLFIRDVVKNFEITEELACMRSLKGTTTGCDIFREFQEGFLISKVPITKKCNITTDEAPNMIGEKIWISWTPLIRTIPGTMLFSTLCYTSRCSE